MSNIYKIILFNIFIGIYLFVLSIFWSDIQIPLNNSSGSIGFLTLKNINPFNDTLRFILFIFPPLLLNFIFIKIFFKAKSEEIKFLLYRSKLTDNNFNLNYAYLILVFLIFFIIFEFFQLNFPNTNYLDTLHDGDYLAAIYNHIYYGGYWATSFTVHGGENILLPLIAYKFIKLNIASIKFIPYILTLFIKILTLFLSFHIAKISKLPNKLKLIFFFIFSIYALSLSKYGAVSYINIRDIFVIIFFIILIQIYTKNLNNILIYLLTLTTTVSFIFHYDTGTYLHVLTLLIFFHLLISKEIKKSFLMVFFLIFNWLLIFNFFGSAEMTSMFEQYFQLVFNIDKMHGLEYPNPFTSMGVIEHGTRATKALLFVLILGFITTFIIFIKNNYFTINEKSLLVIFYIYSIFSFKNALGRSDGAHIMLSSDWISLLLCFYFLHLFFYKFSQILDSKINEKNINKILGLLIIILISFNFNYQKILTYKDNFKNYISSKDENFISIKRREIIKDISFFVKKEKCVQNFTADLSLPYLINKPNCTKFISPWIASGTKFENEFIKLLKRNKVNYIIYSSPAFFVDEIKTSSRLKVVNEFITNNYRAVFSKDGYVLFKKI